MCTLPNPGQGRGSQRPPSVSWAPSLPCGQVGANGPHTDVTCVFNCSGVQGQWTNSLCFFLHSTSETTCSWWERWKTRESCLTPSDVTWGGDTFSGCCWDLGSDLWLSPASLSWLPQGRGTRWGWSSSVPRTNGVTVGKLYHPSGLLCSLF